MSNPESLQVAWRIDSWMVFAPEAKKHRELQYELEDGLDNATLSHQDAITRLTEALTASPDWLEGLLLRAALHSELDEHADSARDYKRAYIRCMAVLPKNFKGPLPWSILDNRTFLRAVAAWGLELVGQQRYDDAIPVLRKLLEWNPNDNQGIRYVLGPTLLRAGRRRQSMKALAETAGENPAMRYELGLAQFEDEKYVDAATTLRHAGIENPYIAEHLTGTLFPEPMPLWLGSNLHDYEGAYDYEEHWSKRWEENGEATDFLRWLHTHPRVMAERAAALAPVEELLWEQDVPRRHALIEKRNAVRAGIDDALSKEIVVRRELHGHGTDYPWRLLRARREEARGQEWPVH